MKLDLKELIKKLTKNSQWVYCGSVYSGDITIPSDFTELLCMVHQPVYNSRCLDAIIVPKDMVSTIQTGNTDTTCFALLWDAANISKRLARTGATTINVQDIGQNGQDYLKIYAKSGGVVHSLLKKLTLERGWAV